MAATNTQSLPQTSLYVGDLHPFVTESQLYDIFSTMGHVLSARVCRDVALHTSLGYGYVNFENSKDADRALENLNYEEVLGRQIRIMWCQRDPSLRKSGRGNIFIKNLDKSIAQKDLYDTFCHFGKILSCKIAIDEVGMSKGYGFIHFHDEECAKAAIKATDKKMINERIVTVVQFRPKSERISTDGKLKFTNCYVKNFGEEVTDESLNKIFSEFGEIRSACVMRDSEGKSKGFGFVCFAEPKSADDAVQNLNEKNVDGHVLYVSRAQRKSERQEVLRQHFEKQRAERVSKYAAGINLYVKNLDDTIDDVRLKDAFSSYGKITSTKVMTDNMGHSKGFGFVCFTTAEEAKEAVSMNGVLLGSKPLYVALAQRREDRRAKLFAEHQQRLQYRVNIGNMPGAHQISNFFGQPGFQPTQKYFNATPMASQPRWNRAVLPPQVQLTHGGMGSVSTMRQPNAPQYIGNAGAMAGIPQNQLVQGNMMASQFRNQANARSLGGVPTMNAMAMSNQGSIIAPGAGGPHHQYSNQRNISQMMPQSNGVFPRATMAAVTAGAVRPSPNQMQIQNIAQNVQAASAVRFNNSARNVSSQPQQGLVSGSRQIGDQPLNLPNINNLTERDQKQYLGEKIFRKIEKIEPQLAGKLTGMLIGMDAKDLMQMCESDEFLRTKVQEGIAVLKNREVNSISQESNVNNQSQSAESGEGNIS